jgi:hypothetical protein
MERPGDSGDPVEGTHESPGVAESHAMDVLRLHHPPQYNSQSRRSSRSATLPFLNLGWPLQAALFRRAQRAMRTLATSSMIPFVFRSTPESVAYACSSRRAPLRPWPSRHTSTSERPGSLGSRRWKLRREGGGLTQTGPCRRLRRIPESWIDVEPCEQACCACLTPTLASLRVVG